MKPLVRLTHVRLRWHLLLVSIPFALVGLVAACALFMVWLIRPQPSEAFLMAAANWAVMSVWSAYAAVMLANTWRTAGAAGLHLQASWLEALPIVSGFQAGAAVAMLFTAIGWEPAALIYAPFLIIFGAPWASLSWHLRRLGRQRQSGGQRGSVPSGRAY
ncbi:hypothetical protein CLM74_03135 [Stenotrophomonas sp. MYb57]|uniref:hypothetical protein n=1 Tax=Stenotrophomonas sp. MYb57 TaxID=1827305 RepID=UPI000CF5F4AD|nr:hypothetical protein [Stenotrophomonas sp. MYb57]AVJ31846.1 hypothetical protein CLM74_03135 [Stenotrophomonas sp. MYb57]